MLDQNTDRMWFVIGAVIVGAAIIFIANGTLPTLFASVTDSFEGVATDGMMAIDVLSSDSIHRLDRERYEPRLGTYARMDDDVLTLSEEPALRIDYTIPSEGEREGKHDFVVWFDQPYTGTIKQGDIMDITFYAKSEKPVKTGLRLGALFDDVLADFELGAEWEKHTLRLPVAYFKQYLDEEGNIAERYQDNIKGALVFWSYEPSTVWMSDLNIDVYTNE